MYPLRNPRRRRNHFRFGYPLAKTGFLAVSFNELIKAIRKLHGSPFLHGNIAQILEHRHRRVVIPLLLGFDQTFDFSPRRVAALGQVIQMLGSLSRGLGFFLGAPPGIGVRSGGLALVRSPVGFCQQL